MVSKSFKREFANTDIGIIPDEWEVKQLQEIAKVTGGKRLPKGNSLSQYNTGHPYIRVSDMGEKGISLQSIMYVPLDIVDAIKRYRVKTGDLYISVAGTLGLVGEVPKELDGANLTENADKISEIHCDRKYLLWVLRSELIQKAIKKEQTSNAQPKLALTRIKDFLIPIPPRAEQSKIAEILSVVNEAIGKTEAIIEQTEKVKKGLMQQLLTKGIGHTKFKKTKVGEIPREWEVKTFNDLLREGYIIDIQDGNHGNSHPKANDYVTRGIPFIMANNLVNGTLDLVNCKFLKKEQTDKLRIGFSIEGDVLLTHKGTIGKAAIVPRVESYVMLTPQVTYYRVDGSRLSNKFLKYFFEGEYFQNRLEKLSAQSTRSYIGITNQKNLLMAMPTLEEQEQIVRNLEVFDEKLGNEVAKLEQFQILKKGLMQSLLTGKIRVKVDEAEVKQV
ncbi:restriction endonuclease subunit S [Bacillus sp. EKM202B]|uniref:restriction endonuclease subunit S n=1 Tax=Bacillus sp. EKM202B TaxID=1683596 RepID=UPI0013EE75EE|nr:restriction endonuclease subunit S [Bacillus sp. EKM202B]KAF6552396.1 restriction endonuclease subunit S [Bacillus sp. EKM202B]